MALIYENKVPESYRVEFVEKVKKISANLGIDPNWLMAIMYFESARTFSPSITNSIGATGLIQFLPSTAISLGTSTSELRKMTAVKQLDYVEKYLKPYKGKLKSYIDVYFSVFFPLAIGKPDDWVIQAKGISASAVYNSNPAFRVVKDGKIRVWEVKKVMLEKLPSEWINNGSFSLAIKAYKNYIGIGLLLIVAGATLYYKYGRTK
jgi:hypothetical protein